MARNRYNDLDSLSYAELIALEGQIKKAIIERKAAEAQATRQQLRVIAEKAGFDINELFGKRSRKASSAIKYRNPKDAAQTWTGRGRKPNWLVEALKNGGDLDSFFI